MTIYKTLGLGMAMTLLAASGPAIAQDHSDMTDKPMDHSQMKHDDQSHDHATMDHATMDHATMDHATMDKETLADSPAMEGTPMIIAKVNGLVCDFCAQALRKIFKKEAAVQSLNVDLDAGEVHIALKDNQTLSDETVKELIRKSGYSLVEINRENGA